MGHNNINRRSVIKRTAMGAGVLGLSSLAGCTADTGNDGSNVDDTVEMTFASSYETDHVSVQAAQRFKEIVEEKSDGEFLVEIIAGGSYGGEGEITQLCREGVLEAHADSRWPFENYTPEYYFINIPIVFEDFEHLVRVTNSAEFQPALDKIISEGNQRKIGEWVDRGRRHFTSNVPVRNPADVEGIKLRLPPIEEWVAIWEELGADPTTVALDELYSSLLTGTVEASEGDIPQIHSFDLNEVQDYLSYTGHHVQVAALYMNEEFYQGLDDDYRDLVDEAATEATQEISSGVREAISDMEAELEDKGMELVKNVDQEAFVEGARPVVEGLFENFEGTLDQWQSI